MRNKKSRAFLIFLVVMLLFNDLLIVAANNQNGRTSIPFHQGEIIVKSDRDINGYREFLRPDDTAGEVVLGYYRYPTIYDGQFARDLSTNYMNSSLNSSFTVLYDFNRNGGHDRSSISYAYAGHGYTHLIDTAGRNHFDYSTFNPTKRLC